MTNNYILSCCSTADLSKNHFEERQISYICFHYMLDNVSYPDDLGQTIPFSEFYQRMVDGADTRTSQVNVSEYVDYFTKFMEQGKDVLHICLSSGISGTLNSATTAAEMVSKLYPERKLLIVDSLGASSGYGLLMDTLADKRDAGMDIDSLYTWTIENRLRVNHWFFSSDLTFFIKGGRVSKTAGFFGGLLGICPLLNVNNKGQLIPRSKVRGKKRVITEIVDRMETNADKGLDYDGKCYISESACLGDAQAVAQLIETRFPHLNGKVVINSIGTTIGSHTGPGTVALFFWGTERKN